METLRQALVGTEYEFINKLDSSTPTKELVKMILEQNSFDYDEYDEGPTLYTDTVWGLCTAYLEFKEGGNSFSKREKRYLATRGGLLTSGFVEGQYTVVTLKQIIEAWDGNNDFEKWLK